MIDRLPLMSLKTQYGLYKQERGDWVHEEGKVITSKWKNGQCLSSIQK